MRITKEAKEYIHAFSTKAARVFQMYGFIYGPPIEESYIPSVEEIERRATEHVQTLSKSCFAEESGRILARKSDFEPGFRLYINLKDLATSNKNQTEVKNNENL